MGDLKERRLSTTSTNTILTYAIPIVGFLIIQPLLSGGDLSSSLQGLLVPICAYIVMAVSLNLTVGVLGELSLGHAGFMSVGAFSGAIACISLQTVIPIVFLRLAVSMVVGAVCAGLVGMLVSIPVLRLRGDYLAIVTLAFGEIIKNVITCLYVGIDNSGLHVGFLLNGISDLHMGDGARTIVEGPMGIRDIPQISTFAMGFALVLVTLFIVLNLVHSRAGRAIMALRDNRIAAESVGIPVTKYKLIAFVTSAALAGAAGTLYVMNFSTMVASKFNFNTSILILVYVVLGGLGNMWGSIVATVILYTLPEALRAFSNYRMLTYAIVLILVMLTTNNWASIRLFLLRVWQDIRRLVLPKRVKKGGAGSE